MQKRHIDSVDVGGKRVFVRVDFNVPMEGGAIVDDRRIRASLPTIRSILSRGGSVVLASHLGRPAGTGFEAEYSLGPVASRLTELLGDAAPGGVSFPSNDCIDDDARRAALALRPGEVLLLENLRFHKGEKKGDAAFAEKLAELGEVYVNDAFGTSHRADASMSALPLAMRAKGAGCAAGHLLAAELEYLYARLDAPEHPFTAILGGAKVSDKILAIENLLSKVDRLVVGGAMAYTFLKAKGVATGASRVEADRVDLARDLLAKAAARGCAVLLPSDHVCGRELKAGTDTMVAAGDISEGWMGLDIGPATSATFAEAIRTSRTVVWNGPMGVFEVPPFDAGTRAVGEAVRDATAAGGVTIAGGGDTAAAVEALGLAQTLSHVSTGGGASLEVLEGKRLVCLDALDDA